MPIFESQAVSVGQTTQSAVNKSALGKDDFLKMLVQQLRFQDPLNPMKSDEFATQLAQFSSVEQLNNISNSLTDSINANYLLTQAINNGLSAGFVGKEVRVSGNTVSLQAVGVDEVRMNLGYTLGSAATQVEIKIRDANGNVVRTDHSSAGAKGDNTYVWDGRDDDGSDLPPGKYTFSVEAKDANNLAVTASTYIFGKVSSVRFTAEGTKIVIDGQEIFLSDVLEILEG
ncbi:MAG: flagellar hook capping protein [Ignavibacteriae bacterium]|nr:flagellar hook capping protein [Ignavibacteriota bacterium]